jgi:hypothetical protein
MSDNPYPPGYLDRLILQVIRETPPFVPGPDPVVEAMREAQAVRQAGRLN